MERNQQPEPQAPARKPYEPPRLQAVELLPEETLGIGCKSHPDINCINGPVEGS